MARQRKLLCPVDFSEGSDAALQRATQLAQAIDAHVELLHVYSLPALALPEGPVMVSADYVSRLTSGAQEALDAARAKLEAKGVKVETTLAQGQSFAAIVEHAKGTDADMIVMGTHGRTGLTHLLLGSVAERVVRTAEVPVLTVRQGQGGDEDASVLDHLLVAYDFSNPAKRSLDLAVYLGTRCKSRLTLLHIHPEQGDGASGDYGQPWETPGQEERYLRFLEEELRSATAYSLTGYPHAVERKVVRGDVTALLLKEIKESGADMVCVGATGKGAVARALLGSSSERLVRTSEVPVLISH